jgi:hypothetical protein
LGYRGLRYRSLRGWVGDRRGHSQREVCRERKQKQQLQGTSDHEAFRFEFSRIRRGEKL